jgi:hypothetical protein
VEKNRTSCSDGGHPAPEQAIAEQLKRLGAGWLRDGGKSITVASAPIAFKTGTVPGTF